MHEAVNQTQPSERIRVGILGDSNSHSYQDRYSFPPGSADRGGAYRRSTFQWTEVLMRLRPDQIDLGEWGAWGQRRRHALMRDFFRLSSRSPRKQDYCYNLAASGAGCNDLVEGVFRQAPRLADIIRKQPAAWQQAIIVIRMGINDIGTRPMLTLMAADPSAPRVIEASANCQKRIEQAIGILRGAQPALRFVIVSPFNNTDDPNNAKEWNSADAQRNLRQGFSHLEKSLEDLTRGDPRLHFINENTSFRLWWGGRDENGRPAYEAFHIGDVLRVTNTVGDDPRHTTLNDDHAGLAWNTLWAQLLVAEMQKAWNLAVTPIADAEVARFISTCIERQSQVGVPSPDGGRYRD